MEQMIDHCFPGRQTSASHSAQRSRRIGAWLLACLYVAWYLLRLPPHWQVDSVKLYYGCQAIVRWLQGRSPTLYDIGPYPLMQYLTGMASRWAGSKAIPIDVYLIWSTCNTLGLAGIAFIFYRAAQRAGRPAVGWAAVVIMLSGPLVAYAPLTFGEGFAAFVTLWFTDAVTDLANPFCGAILFWCSGITKETAAPLLMIIWLGALWMQKRRLNRSRGRIHVAAMLIALFVTVASNGCFNLVRYGTFYNREYLSPQFLIHTWPHRFSYCLSIWLAPNGGVLPSWPPLTLFIVGTLFIALEERERRAPAIVVCCLLGLVTFGLSGWFGPFGWWCWGPRLMLPWLPAAALIPLKGYPAAAERFVAPLLRSGRAFIITCMVVCLLAIPHILFATFPESINGFFDRRTEPAGLYAQIAPDKEFVRNTFVAWRKLPPLLVWPLIRGLSAERVASAAGFLAALIVLLGAARNCLDAQRRDDRACSDC
jgi:hypothetical protein